MDVNEKTGAAEDTPFDAIAAFETRFNPKDADDEREPSKGEDGDTTDDNKADETPAETEADEGDEKSTDEGDEKTEESEETEATADLDDEVKVKVPVDGEEREFTIGALKRLAGQEASLTRKSQDVANHRKLLDDTARTHVAALDKLLERARARYEPWSKIDFLVASKDPNVTAEDLAAARQQSTAAYDDVRFLEEELASFSQQLAERETQSLREQAVEAIKVLSDPEKGIKGWSDQLYLEMRNYAVDGGIPAPMFDRTVNPAVIKMLHKAMLYDRGLKKVQKTTEPTKKAPKRIVKSADTPEATRRVKEIARSSQTLKRLEQTHSNDDAIAAFAERFGAKRSDD